MSCWPQFQTYAGVLCVALLGCSSAESVEKDRGDFPRGLRVETKWTAPVNVLVSETQKPLHFSYALSNVSDKAKELRLLRTSCGCVAVSVNSGSDAKSLKRGSVFTVGPQEHITVTLEVDLSRKPTGLHTFPTELSVVRAGSEEPFSLPEPRVRLLADVSADPPVLSHRFGGADDSVVEKRITLTARQKAEPGARFPEPKVGRLPDYIALKELRKKETVKSDEYLTETWIAVFSLKKPMTEDYTVATSILISFPDSPRHAISIPSVVTVSRGVEVRPQSLTFTSEDVARHGKRCVLVTATDGHPFAINGIRTRSGLCRAVVRESKASVSHLIDVTPVYSTNLPSKDALEIETDHPDTLSITIPLLRAD